MQTGSQKLSILCVCAAIGLGVMAQWTDAGGWRRRANCYPSLPRHNYQSGTAPLRGTLASYPVPVTTGTRKAFTALANELTVGDCSLKQLAAVLYSDGSYVLSFRAANTAKPSALPSSQLQNVEPPSNLQQRGIETGPVRHHRVQVRLRFYSGPGSASPESVAHAGGAVLAEFSTDLLLVAARDEQARSFDGSDPRLRDHFDEITQAEFEMVLEPELPVLPLSSRGRKYH